MKLLKNLYEIHSPSGKEQKMKRFIKTYINKNIPGCIIETDKTGNMYITKGDALSFPCIVAHLDQVQRVHSKDFKAIETDEIIFGYSKKNRQIEGIGADDANGIWICLKMLEKYESLKVVLFIEEEIGCIGSSQADMTFFEDTRYVLQCDRRGNSDFITTIGWTQICSQEFIDLIPLEQFGYNEETGMMTDVEALKENGLSVSAINMSCGYYQPHTNEEITVKSDLLKCQTLVEWIIEHLTDPKYPHSREDDMDEWDKFYHGYKWDKEEDNDSAKDEELLELAFLVEDEIYINSEVTGAELESLYGSSFKTLDPSDYEKVLTEIKSTYSGI